MITIIANFIMRQYFYCKIGIFLLWMGGMFVNKGAKFLWRTYYK